MSAAPPWRIYAVIAGGVAVVATSSILVRLAQGQGVPSLAIAAWRLSIAALILLPFVLAMRGAELRALTRGDWRLAGAAGAFLALHFAAWIASLEYTSVASSVALVTTNPIWIALFSALVLRESMPRVRVVAVALSMAGSATILWADVGTAGAGSPQPALGNALALIVSLTVCGYFLIGRRLRAHMSLLAYIGVVYAMAAVCLMLMAAGAFPSIEVAQDAICPGYRVFEPDPAEAAISEQLYLLYRKLYFSFGAKGSAPVHIGDVLPQLRQIAASVRAAK